MKTTVPKRYPPAAKTAIEPKFEPMRRNAEYAR
jgi:hypothetical protein